MGNENSWIRILRRLRAPAPVTKPDFVRAVLIEVSKRIVDYPGSINELIIIETVKMCCREIIRIVIGQGADIASSLVTQRVRHRIEEWLKEMEA